MKKILIVEDDQDIAEIERDYLNVSGYKTDITNNGTSSLLMLEENNYDLVLLDLMLPGMNGFEVCRQMRKMTDIPILFVTARREDIDKIRGLGLGGDDYIEKPFSPGVLVARVKAHLNQYERLKGKKESVISIGQYIINTDSHRVFKNGREIELRNKEYELFLFLVMNADIVFDKETLYEKIWGMDAIGDNATVAVHINRLRDKMEDNPAEPRHIETVWGAGYRFRV